VRILPGSRLYGERTKACRLRQAGRLVGENGESAGDTFVRQYPMFKGIRDWLKQDGFEPRGFGVEGFGNGFERQRTPRRGGPKYGMLTGHIRMNVSCK
jgi:hypothetical protein